MPPPPLLPPSAPCTEVDFMAAPFWEGHWLRLPEGPGQGVPLGYGAPAAQCPSGACCGDARLAWSRWVYRLPTCFFHFFTPTESRACFNGTHVWGSGDSNWADTQRNLLAHVLALDITGWLVEEEVDDFVINGRSNDMPGARYAPRSPNVPTHDTAEELWPAQGVAWAVQNGATGSWAMGKKVARGETAPHLLPRPGTEYNMSFRLGSIYNAAPSDDGKNFGLASVYSKPWQGRHEAAWAQFREEKRLPNLMFINSGLHDGLRFSGHPFALKDYLLAAEDMVGFWEGLRDKGAGAGAGGVGGGGLCAPRTVWRHTIAPAGASRSMKSNPQKMEVFNRLMGGKLLFNNNKNGSGSGEGGRPHPRLHAECGGVPFATPKPAWGFLDAFDMTFPFHHDNEHSDGGHYGRYWCNTNGYARCDFVDLMMIQVLMNGLGCESSAKAM